MDWICGDERLTGVGCVCSARQLARGDEVAEWDSVDVSCSSPASCDGIASSLECSWTNGSRVQKNAKDKDTFMPKVISLPKDSYAAMVREMKLPFRGIETTSVVGPFFWSSFDQDDDDPHLRTSFAPGTTNPTRLTKLRNHPS